MKNIFILLVTVCGSIVVHADGDLKMVCENFYVNPCYNDGQYIRCSTDELTDADNKDMRYHYTAYYTPGSEFVEMTVTDTKTKVKSSASVYFSVAYPKSGDRHAIFHITDENNSDNSIDCRVFKTKN